MASQTAKSPEGLGIGMGLAVFGLLLLLLPLLLPFAGGWLTVLYVTSMLITGAGVAGALLELDKLRNRPEFSDLGTSVVLLAFAGAFILVRVSLDPPLPVAVVLVLLGVAFVAFGVIGLFMAISKAGARSAGERSRGTSTTGRSAGVRREPLTTKDLAYLGVSILVGLLGIVGNFISALIG